MERKRKYTNSLTSDDSDLRNHPDLKQGRAGTSNHRTVEQVITPYDYEQLKKHYKFVLDDEDEGEKEGGTQDRELYTDLKKKTTTWQERMFRKYHSHLYKTHVLADFSKYETPTSQIGLRWRTEAEVSSGMGVDTCGNKNCPCYFMNSAKGTKVKAKVEDVVKWSKTRQYDNLLSKYYNSSRKSVEPLDRDRSSSRHTQIQACNAQALDQDVIYERQLLENIPYGIGLEDYQVHFSYLEDGATKEELVKLKLCLRCAPTLFRFRGGEIGAKNARLEWLKTDNETK